MIQPGLERISLLLKDVQFPWKAIHVAGTNGKGSICHYAATLLRRRTIRVGQFTSPHLVDRWDCISINEKPIAEDVFKRMEKHYLDLNVREKINASSFEILTATAFTLFNRAKIDIGVIEVGMGGKLDATNILNNQAVSVISKIAKDHEAFLGNTLEEIAKHKAGILRPNVPYIVNPENEWNVNNVIDEYAKEIGAGPRLTGDTPKLRENLYSLPDWRTFATGLRPFQRDNAVLAIIAVKQAVKSIGQSIKDELIADELNKKRAMKPGRFEFTKIQLVFGYAGKDSRTILVDGAHNHDAAIALNNFMSRERRISRTEKRIPPPAGGWSVTWVLAMTEGKDATQYLSTILKPGDNVITTTFGPVDGMPWVKPMDPKALLKIAQSVQDGITGLAMPLSGPLRALCAAKYLADSEQPIVLTGSLYFVGDLHRELRGRNHHDYWKRNASEKDQIAWAEVHNQERERIARLLSGQDTSAIPEHALESHDAQIATQRKEELRAQIDALNKEMDLLAVEELKLLNDPENSAQEDATQRPWSIRQRPNKRQRQKLKAATEIRKNADGTTTIPADASRPFSNELKELGERKKALEGQVEDSLEPPKEATVPKLEKSQSGGPGTSTSALNTKGGERMQRRPSFLLERGKGEM